MASGDVIGSWFNSGYYGHFRSKSRLDFVNEYRQLAKPPPPAKFVKRSHYKPAKHAFSHHDNRHSFLDSALYFEEGLGRRRISSSNYRGQPKLLAWVPHTKEIKRQGAVSSVYRVDFQGTPKQPIQQKFIERPKTSFDDRAPITTTYRYAHGPDNPNKRTLSATSNAGLTATPSGRNRARSARADSGSVASCMNWYKPQPPSRPNVPQATSMMIPVPPSAPKGNTASAVAMAPPPSTVSCPAATVPAPPPPPPVPAVKLALTE